MGNPPVGPIGGMMPPQPGIPPQQQGMRPPMPPHGNRTGFPCPLPLSNKFDFTKRSFQVLRLQFFLKGQVAFSPKCSVSLLAFKCTCPLNLFRDKF